MDTNRQLPDPPSHHPPPPRLMASPQTRPIAPYQQPSLPSIRQLHPYLPPSGMAQHLPPSDPSTYTYPLSSPYSGPSGSSEMQQPPSQHALYGRSEMIDSEPEGEIEQQGPAKKKRRRQALSCNGKFYLFQFKIILLIVIDFNLCPLVYVLTLFVHITRSLKNVNGVRLNVTGWPS